MSLLNIVFLGRFVLTLRLGFRSFRSIETSKETSNGTEVGLALLGTRLDSTSLMLA